VKPLAKLQIEQALQQPPKKNSALLWLERFLETEQELRKVWEPKIQPPAIDAMLALVNSGDSPAHLEEFRRAIPPLYDIAQENDHDLLTLRAQLRSFWHELAKERGPSGSTGLVGDNTKVAIALHKWWKRYDLDSDGYFIDWATGSFFPTQKNFRGLIARALVDKRRYLAQCPNCSQYFIKKRDDQKYCLAVTCQRRANTLRQQKFQSTHGKRSARKGKGRA